VEVSHWWTVRWSRSDDNNASRFGRSVMTATISRILTPAKSEAWHVVGHEEARTLLSDERIGLSHPDPANAAWYRSDDVAGRPHGGSDREYIEHRVWRRTMALVFSNARLTAAAANAGETAGELLSQLAVREQPVDLIREFAIPFCSRIILGMMDIPLSDVELFQRWSSEGAVQGDLSRALDGMQQMLSFVMRLARERRDGGATDVISHLMRETAASGSAKDNTRAVKLLAGMLAFGRETPAAALISGVLLLLTHPEQRARLQADPGLVPSAVEEVLRFFPPPAATPDGLLRYAHTELRVGDHVIPKGDMLLIDIFRANFDERVFASPERFDVGRQPNPHLAFGSGPYMCNFAKLARLELAAGLGALLTHLPGLELAVPAADLRYKGHLRTRVLEALPVTW
jgi:cytochrome P450